MPTSRGVHKTLENGELHLTRWLSNNAELVQMLQMSDLSPNQFNLDLTDPMVERCLGALWNFG